MKAIDLAPGDTFAVGSLPHVDLEDALVVAESATVVATAPSLPVRDPREHLVAQAAAGVRGVTVCPDGSLEVDSRTLDAVDPVETILPVEAFGSLLAFLDRRAAIAEPIKLQLGGPVTLALALVRAGVEPTLAFAVGGATVRARALAVVSEAMARAPLAKQYVFLDEPGLVAVTDPAYPVSFTDTIDLVSGALAAIEPHAVTGLHCCGSTDWRLVQQAGPQILSLPIDVAADAQVGPIATHLERGGWIAWGAVPTDGPISSSSDIPWRHLNQLWCELVRGGCDPVLLRERSVVTPACGLAHHTVSQVDHVFDLADAVGSRIQTQTSGLRLTVGA